MGGFTVKIEVECRSCQDAMEALSAGADIVMLDNAEPHEISSWTSTIKQAYPSCLIEISGGITPENIVSRLFPGSI